MIRLTCILFSLLLHSLSFSQDVLIGTWEGILIPNNQKAIIVPYYIQFEDGNKITCREEILNQEYYSVRTGKMSNQKEGVLLTENLISKRNASPKITICKRNYSLKYNNLTGYLEGTYNSSDCRSDAGKIVLYRSASKFPSNDKVQASHVWASNLQEDLNKNLKAPEIRAMERANFKFETIYFDYDKDVIKSEYEAFLNEMIRVVSSHTDLRVLVIGNTDSDGSDNYNDDLSKRRAQAIINYFKSHGLSEDHLEFQWNGEKNPVDLNSTPEGKQKNRRVEFRFI